MSWRKHFKVHKTNSSPLTNAGHTGSDNFGHYNWASNLPEIYIGHPNRIERYAQYENMDNDSEVNASLDILAEFCTQKNIQNGTGFDIHFYDEATDSEVKILKEALTQWWKINEFENRLFRIFRSTLKYGDQIFIRDPETLEWFWVNMQDVIKVIVNEGEGKQKEQYVVRNINPNFQNMTATQKTHQDQVSGQTSSGTSVNQSYVQPNGAYGSAGGSRFENQINEFAIESEHVVHCSLTEGMDVTWPFGNSILEKIFKVFKQKELLEDAMLIYRIQRAPERRVFKVDVGNMPPHMAMAFVERVKNEIHQKRLPSQSGGSNAMDATYNPLCLDLSTRIPLLDGRTLSLNHIIDEFNEGKENWVYSTNPENGEIVPGPVSWAGITRENAEVVKLTFDNGETLTCTPDHKIPVLGKGFVSASELTADDSLISHNTQQTPITTGKKHKDKTYTQVFDHNKKNWIYVHRMVANFMKNKTLHEEFTYLDENINLSKNTIHHKDYTRNNNNPSNLCFMNKEDHIKFHSENNFWNVVSDAEAARIKNKISIKTKRNWDNMNSIDKAVAVNDMRTIQQKAVWMRKNDPETKASYAKNMSASQKIRMKENPKALAQLLKNAENRVPFNNQEMVLTQQMLGRVVSIIVKNNTTTKTEVLKLCDADSILMNMFRDANPKTKRLCKIDFDKWGYSKMDKLITQEGYSNWKDFTKKVSQYNHKVVSIEYLEETMDVGTITVDGLEEYHNYHTFAIDAGIYVKNSINEDYFFPTTADGRGSSVDVLPGGDNLGEINDLLYFNNKMMRAMRIPSSYLPTGPEEGTQTYNDGRMGTALIQEKVFNDYCMRLQNLIAPTFDDEFKVFLKDRGYQIDNSIFDLRFNEPQNFSAYREVEVDSNRIGTFTQLQEVQGMSKRFLMKRYLGLSEEEMEENDRLWREENLEEESTPLTGESMRGLGISPGGFDSDMDIADPDQPDLGMEGDEMGGDLAGGEAAGGEPPPEI